MSAYMVDERTIDYLVAWAIRRDARRDHGPSTRTLWRTWAEIPEDLIYAAEGSAEAGGWRLDLSRVHPADIGRILLAENARSVGYRYGKPEPVPDYTYRQIRVQLRPDWVVKSCRCLEYQSCETPDWNGSIAHAILEAIQYRAIVVWTDAAPWGVTAQDLEGCEAEQVREEARS